MTLTHDAPSSPSTVVSRVTSPIASPPNTAALVKLGSGLVGRQHRGRMYLPGVLLDADVEAGGTIDPSAHGSITGVMAYLFDLLLAESIVPVILHSGVGTPTLVTNPSVETTAATQRRRLRRRR